MKTMTDYESIQCIKHEVFVYQIPPIASNRGYRATDWNLGNPEWTGRLKLVSKANELKLKLEDKGSGELFACCPIENYPSIAISQVTDSSRYFAIRIQDDSGKKATIGIGFSDRGDSFDLLVAIQDHFKQIKREASFQPGSKDFDPGPKLDLGFKEGETIKINLNRPERTSKKPNRPKAHSSGTGLLLPPPGSGSKLGKLNPPPSQASENARAFSQPSCDLSELLGQGNSGVSVAPLTRGGLDASSQLSSNSLESQFTSIATANNGNPRDVQGVTSTDLLGNVPGLVPLNPALNSATAGLAQLDLSQNSDPWGDFRAASDAKSNDWINF